MSLRVSGLVKRYPRRLLGAEPPAAVDGVDLEVRDGEVVALVGESGSGKTTLVRCALGLLPFQSGKVEILGQDLAALRGAALRRARRDFQMLLQDPTAMLNPGLTVRQHLEETARLHRPEAPMQPLVQAIAARVGLAHRLDALPREMSGGERRRAGLARVLLVEPKLLVADEPTSGLDAALKADLIDLLLTGKGPGRSWLIVSHDLPLVAYGCDRVYVMLAGRVVERAPVATLGKTRHHPYTEALLRAAGMLGGQPAPGQEPIADRASGGCPWRGACPRATERCITSAPELLERAPEHAVACHNLEDTP